MKRLYFFLLLNFLFFPSSAQTWEWSNPKPCGNVMEEIYFTDPSTGYIVGTGGTIMKTFDGGDTWNILNSGTLYDLYDLSFPNANTGYAVGANGIILKTTDAGTSWINKSNSNDPFYAVNFPTVDTGYTCKTVVDGWGNYGEEMHKTTDGGNTWSKLSISGNPLKVYFMTSDTGFYTGQGMTAGAYSVIRRTTDGGITWNTCWSSSTIQYTEGISFIDRLTGFVVGAAGTILKTTDGGSTWQSMMSGTTNNLFSVFFINALTGFASGDSGIVLKTTNGGVTWTTRTAITDGRFYSVGGSDLNHLFFLGQKALPYKYESSMYKSVDGGNSYSNMLTGTLHDLKDVCFPASNTGVAVGDSGTIVRTVDGGSSWSVINTGNATGLNAVDFPSSGTGYAAGRSGRILKTIDGGISWSVLTTCTNRQIHGVDFIDDFTGFAVGDSGTIIKTENGGNSWTSQASGTLQNLCGVSVAGPSTAYIAARDAILKTADGGVTWATIKTCSTFSFYYSIDFVDQNIGYAAGREIIKTTDGGVTWSEYSFGGNDIFYSVRFRDAMTGYAVGMLDSLLFWPGIGIIQQTTDGGATWTDRSMGNNRALHAVCITPDNAGFSCGEFGTILKTTGGVVGISGNPVSHSIKLFPNPASDFLTIDCQSAMKGEIAIYNIDGRKICTSPVTSKKTVKIDIRDLLPGVYCVTIIDDQLIRVVEKFIKE